tara:strand:- start:24699 stop:25838 length:1140 start_codon:yes stop_codon:yes gene_type:complete
MIIDLDTNTTLPNFLKDLVSNRFPNDSIKQEIDFSNPKKINLACPICGDSEKKKSKKRGNIYLESKTYKCYNDGCMIFMTLDKFIAKYCQEYSLMPPDMFVKGELEANVKSRKKLSLLNFLINDNLKEKLLDIDYFTHRFSLTRIKKSKNSNCKGYAKARKLDICNSFLECCYEDSKSEKIFIFNKDDVSNKILGYSVRAIDDNYRGPKYKMMNYSEIDKDISRLFMSKDQLNEIDSLNNIFNILNVDFKKIITICEGQFDSMFLYNGIASTGTGKIKETISMLSEETKFRILFDNDKAGKNQSIKLLQDGYTVFMWSKLIKDLKKDFPHELIDIKKINDVNSLYVFLSSINGPMFNIKEFNSTLNAYFTNSMFDILYL